jgi:hypothetical protein
VISIYGVLELSAVSAHCSLPTKFSVFESWLLYVLLSLPRTVASDTPPRRPEDREEAE